MPLVIISGYPCSGKSKWAKALKEDLEERIKSDSKLNKVVLIEQECDRSIYGDSKAEKVARSSLLASIERNLSRSTIVIADDLNYIKGYRYQLFCLAKNMSTSSCVIFVAAQNQSCRDWNSNRKAVGKPSYDDKALCDLLLRFEEPNDMNRWDSPLFTVTEFDDKLPLESIWEALLNTKKAIPNSVTKRKDGLGTDKLVHIDQATDAVVQFILNSQRDRGVGSLIPYAHLNRDIQLPQKFLNMPILQRYRKQFSQIYRLRTGDEQNLEQQFINYLESQWLTL